MELRSLAGTDLGTKEVSYDEKDAILYALAVDAHASELDLVYERDLRVLPTFAITLGLWAIDAVSDLGVYDPATALHASQSFALRQPLPRAASFEITGRVDGVWDKGSAAIIDVAAGCEAFEATYSIFLRGLGGWGGERGSAGRPAPPVGEAIRIEEATSGDQAALYRLTGDDHPVHVDPEVARANGFDRPILHGLCTLGFAARHVARAAGAHPTDLRQLSVRFAAPVYPGDSLATLAWPGRNGTARFETLVGNTTVLAAGSAAFSRS